ncbi:MAG: cation transporter [Flavobacteriales bacterium]|nr:cation transporter [Flavobacteriales bacterium]
MSGEKIALRATFISMVSNALLAVLKGLTGYFGNSYALIADAIESTTDVFSSLLVWLGLRYSMRPPDHDHPYGHGRAEPLVTFMVVAFLFISATVIAYESILHIRTPHEAPHPFTLIVLGAIIVWKELSYRWVARKGKETHSTALKADAWHHRSDAITSLAAFIGISIAVWKGPGYEAADDWAALLASVFIAYNAYLILRPALGEIMDEQLHAELVMEIERTALSVPGILTTEKCYVRKIGMRYYVDLHARVNGDLSVRDGHALAHVLKTAIQAALPEVAEVLIHVEPEEG